MIRFDFLHNAEPSPLRVLREARLPRRLHSVVSALIGVVAVVSAVWLIESYRVQAAITMERHYSRRLAGSSAALLEVHFKYRHLRELVMLDAKIREIRGSGNRTALQLAQIGSRLPAHIWLTAIDSDKGLLLDGEARGLVDLSHAVSNFAQDGNSRPILVNAAALPANTGPDLIRYQLRLGEQNK